MLHAAWTGEYARRVRLTMQAYAPAGRGRVLWLTLPLPRSDERRAITSAVNGAIVSVAASLTGIKVLRMDLIFTPDGYRDVRTRLRRTRSTSSGRSLARPLSR